MFFAMSTWTQSVISEMVSDVSYDDEKQEMIVTWKKSGKRSAYSGVGEDVALQCANAPSVGQFINSEVKPFYGHRYV